jgi:probable rRNA maturation factor
VAGSVQLIFTDDDYMQHLNTTFRNQDFATDVLSFNLTSDVDTAPPELEEIGGEIYISLERARAQAAEQQVPLIVEVAHLFVHGLLHLSGYDHDTSEKLRFMESETDRFLQAAGLSDESPTP